MKILVVDDQRSARRVLKQILAHLSYAEVLEADSAEAAKAQQTWEDAQRLKEQIEAEKRRADAGDAAQQAAAAPLGELTINPIGRLTCVFQHQDRPLEIG